MNAVQKPVNIDFLSQFNFSYNYIGSVVEHSMPFSLTLQSLNKHFQLSVKMRISNCLKSEWNECSISSVPFLLQCPINKWITFTALPAFCIVVFVIFLTKKNHVWYRTLILPDCKSQFVYSYYCIFFSLLIIFQVNREPVRHQFE